MIELKPENNGHWRMVLVDDRNNSIAEVLLDDSCGDMHIAISGVADELALWVEEHPEMIGGTPNARRRKPR